MVPCRLPRKQAAPRQQVKGAIRTGFTVHRDGRRGDYYGFELDGDRRYLLDDFTVTHNSGKSAFSMLILRRLLQLQQLPDHTVVATSRTQLVHDLRAMIWRGLDPSAAHGGDPRSSPWVGQYDSDVKRLGRVTVTTYPSLPACL